MRKKKVKDMNVAMNTPLIGTRDFRNNLADYLKQVYDKNQVLRVGKSNRPEESAMIISSTILGKLVENTTFQSKVYFDKPTNQYSAEVEDLLGGGVGDTEEDAIEMALDNIEALVEHFFENINWYLQYPEHRDKLPKYLKLKLAGSREQLAEILGLR
jgi:predicted RNase H-like HicB family nuclease